MQDGLIYCAECGTPSNWEDYFCATCGADLPEDEGGPPPLPLPPPIPGLGVVPSPSDLGRRAQGAAGKLARAAAPRLFTGKRFLFGTVAAVLLFGWQGGWQDVLQKFGPLHALLGFDTPAPTNWIAGAIMASINGFIVGIPLGFLKRMFSSRETARAALLVCVVFLLLAPAASADDGAFVEIMRDGDPLQNIPALLVSAAGAGIGIATGIGTVTVIVGGRATSVTRVNEPADAPRGGGPRARRPAGRRVSQGAGPATVRGPPPPPPRGPEPWETPPSQRETDPGDGEEEEKEPPNFTLDIQTDDRGTLEADGKDAVRIVARVYCDKPDVDTTGIARGIRFDASGPAADWVRLDGRTTTGSITQVSLRASPPTPDAELANPSVRVTVIMAIGPRTFRGHVDLTIERGEYELEITFPDG